MAAPFPLTTADPRFNPKERVTVNGYEYVPASEYERLVAIAKTALEDQAIAAYERSKAFEEGKALLERVKISARRVGKIAAAEMQRPATVEYPVEGALWGMDTSNLGDIGCAYKVKWEDGRMVYTPIPALRLYNETTDG